MNNIGVVIVNWNTLKYTLEFLEDFKKASSRGDILVIVNNSPEDNVKLNAIKSPNVKVFNTNKNLGYSGGLNFGLKYLREKTKINWFLVINNDVQISQDFLDTFRRQNDENTIYSPVITNIDKKTVQNTGGKLVLLYGGTINLNKGKQLDEIKKIEPDFLSGCCMYFHKSVIDRIGFFDESYESYFEDVDFCFRARRKGINLEVLWDLILPHYHSMSTKNISGYKDYLITRNAIKFAKADLSGIKRYIFVKLSIIVGFFWVAKRPRNLPFYFRGVKDGLL